MNRNHLWILLLLIVAAPASAQMTYDDFADIESREERQDLFFEQSPEIRTELAHEHYSRWLAANHTRFTAKQMYDLLTVFRMLTPSLYETGLVGQEEIEAKEFVNDRLRPFLQPMDFIHGMQPLSIYLPPIAQ
jgi:hypothetical protein